MAERDQLVVDLEDVLDRMQRILETLRQETEEHDEQRHT